MITVEMLSTMKYRSWYLLITSLILLPGSMFALPEADNSLVVHSTELTKESTDQPNVARVNPQIYSMLIHSNVSNRFARTLITSKVRNLEKKAEGTTFSVILPENAFISEFEMEIKEKVYKAYVKEKEEAKKIYQEAVSSGQSAAHVELSARDSKTFTVSVNIEPESKTIFRLVYEELLQRQIGQYELVINIHPGQIVEDLGVQVYINESRSLTFVRTPSLRTGNEISKNDDKLDPSAEIEIINNNSAIVKFTADKNEQKKFAENLGSDKDNGLAGQFVVQYDVERDPQGGEVLVRDGYFVHFFAPSELQPLPKHVVFVLDHSGSMTGRNIEQLIEAMQNILSELHSDDLFNIIRFADDASVWNPTESKFIPIRIDNPQYGKLEPHLRETNISDAVEATKENVEKAKKIVNDTSDMGLTNIIAGLEIGLFLTKKTQEKLPHKFQPMIVFLTDGFPNLGLSSSEEITNTVTKLNSGKTAIFSLSFGDGADKDFLRKLSSRNHGFSRHIYAASDASLQLEDFYKLISSPLLNDITFSYVDSVSKVTNTHFPIFFEGSELVVAGKTGENVNVLRHINAMCTTGRVEFNSTRLEPISSLERLWAYLTVKQILKERETANNATEPTRKALELSLKYSFVTDVSSLVVVRPNQTDTGVDSENKGPSEFDADVDYDPAPNYPMPMPMPMPRPSMNPGTYVTSTRPPIPTAMPGSASEIVYPLTDPPQWLAELKKNNKNITTPKGMFKLGNSGDVSIRPVCPKTPLNGTGICTIIFDCPQVYSFLTDINVYLGYFCSLNEFAGVCCPVN